MVVVMESGARRAPWAGRAQQLLAAPRAPEVFAAALSAAALAESVVRVAGTASSPGTVAALGLLAVGTTLPLAWLRPAGATVALWAATVLSLAAFHVVTVAGCVALLVAVYRLGRAAGGRLALAIAVLLPVSFLALAIVGARPLASEADLLTVVLAALAPAAAWGGLAERSHRRAEEYSAARQVIAGTLLEHTARGERARIARELHDVVAHHISMVAVQAETARLTTPGMPAAGAEQLSAIGDTARAALTEMRRLLGVLRTDTQLLGAERPPADRHPQPGLSQLNDLLDQARRASGTGIRLVLTGTPVVLDPGVELAAYRITQEALTNARRHAPGAAVDVELRYTTDALRLRIRDNGPGLSDSALHPTDIAAGAGAEGGQGLPGMRERATAVGGGLRAGAPAGGGFFVEAILPVPTEQAVPGLLATAVAVQAEPA